MPPLQGGLFREQVLSTSYYYYYYFWFQRTHDGIFHFLLLIPGKDVNPGMQKQIPAQTQLQKWMTAKTFWILVAGLGIAVAAIFLLTLALIFNEQLRGRASNSSVKGIFLQRSIFFATISS
jgi:hypothetical protein